MRSILAAPLDQQVSGQLHPKLAHMVLRNNMRHPQLKAKAIDSDQQVNCSIANNGPFELEC
ncbi:MAG: hypothetical protein B7Y41_03680 [Hydrogenophilales bacterium 28-61-23]|nr:MAG: hypothetical protein B7Y41_03680 [Hydrogenophilales bacterium 28-61-23]